MKQFKQRFFLSSLPLAIIAWNMFISCDLLPQLNLAPNTHSPDKTFYPFAPVGEEERESRAWWLIKLLLVLYLHTTTCLLIQMSGCGESEAHHEPGSIHRSEQFFLLVAALDWYLPNNKTTEK